MSTPPTPPTSPLVATAAAPTTAAPPSTPTIIITPPVDPLTCPTTITSPNVANTVSRDLLRTTITLSTQIAKLDRSTTTLHKTYTRRLRTQMRENRHYILNHPCASGASSSASSPTTGAADCGVVDVSDPAAADARLQRVIARAYEVESERRCRRARGLYAAAVQRAEVAMEAVEEFERVVVELPGRVGGVLRGCEGNRNDDEENEDEGGDEGGDKQEGWEKHDEQGVEMDDEESEQMDGALQDPGRGEGGYDLAGKLLRDSLALKRKIDGILKESERKRRREEEEDAHGRFDYDIVSVSLRHSLMLKRRLDAMYQKSRHGVEAQG